MRFRHNDVLCCPICRSNLILIEKTEFINDISTGHYACSVCKREYPLKQGIPIIWLDDAECVKLGQADYKDYVLNPRTLATWATLPDRSAEESKLWNRSQSILRWRKYLFVFAGILLIIGAVGLVFNARLSLTFFLITTLIVTGHYVMCWWLSARHVYCCRYNFFRHSAQRIVDLASRQGLSERLHFGGGERVFEAWTGAVSDNNPTRRNEESVRKESEQQAFVERKSRFIRTQLSRLTGGPPHEGWQVLCLGCGGVTHQGVNSIFHEHGCNLIGVDTQDFNTLAFQQIFQADAILANAMRLPLAASQFDCVVFTDVLEHLHDPVTGLREIHRVIKPGGLLLLTTNNRHHHKLVTNPVLLFLMLLGSEWPTWLPRRDVLQEWDGKAFYHTEFARRELKDLLHRAGFRMHKLTSNNFFSDERDALRFWPRLAEWLGMGEEYFVLATRSPSSSGKMSK